MLKKLSISNYALINALELSPESGMIVMTGETGAGKSIVLGALGLLMGNRADTKVLFNENSKCVVEAAFVPPTQERFAALLNEHDLDNETELLIRREISGSGKSRAFVNDTPVTLNVLRDISDQVIDIHSQHQTLLLRTANYQLDILDAFAGNEELLFAYRAAFRTWKKALKERKQAEEEVRKQQEELDYNTFQLKEFENLEVQSQEAFDALEEELNTAENAEFIKTKLAEADQMMQSEDVSVLTILGDLRHILDEVGRFSKEAERLSERIESARLEIQDVANEVERKAGEVEYDPARVEWLRNQIDQVNGLLHKHRTDDFSGLMDVREKLQEKVDQATHADHFLDGLRKKEREAGNDMRKRAMELQTSRKGVAVQFSTDIQQQLAELGMPNARLEVKLTETEPNENGIDEVELLFSANKGVTPEKLQKVASGGEFSRLMFAVKYVLAQKTNLPTMIFDEIDTGISGEIAIKMGRMMKKMSASHQVITITHLPQVAALGNQHYKVYKEETESSTATQVRGLSNDERELEIAKMISGDNPSDVAFKNARELLSLDTL